MHEVLVNRLGGLSLPRKSVVRLTDRPDMTLDVYRGRKTLIQQHIWTCYTRHGVFDYVHTVKILYFRTLWTPNMIPVIVLNLRKLVFKGSNSPISLNEDPLEARNTWRSKHCRPWSDCSFWSSLSWVCTDCSDMSVLILTFFAVKYINYDNTYESINGDREGSQNTFTCLMTL